LKLDQSESGPDPTHSLLSIVDSTREILTGFNDPRMESHSRKGIASPASEPIYGSTETLKLMEAADLEAPADQDDPPAMP